MDCYWECHSPNIPAKCIYFEFPESVQHCLHYCPSQTRRGPLCWCWRNHDHPHCFRKDQGLAAWVLSFVLCFPYHEEVRKESTQDRFFSTLFLLAFQVFVIVIPPCIGSHFFSQSHGHVLRKQFSKKIVFKIFRHPASPKNPALAQGTCLLFVCKQGWSINKLSIHKPQGWAVIGRCFKLTCSQNVFLTPSCCLSFQGFLRLPGVDKTLTELIWMELIPWH